MKMIRIRRMIDSPRKTTMLPRPCPKTKAGTNRRAVALVLTLVVLIVLTTLVYTLAARLSQVKHRRQYIIDYQVSRYARDSAMKYALDAIKQMSFNLIKRKDVPDFSDLFTMSRAEYAQFLEEWAVKIAEAEALEEAEGSGGAGKNITGSPDTSGGLTGAQTDKLLDDFTKLLNEPNSITTDPNFIIADYTEPNALIVPGPYGPEWPHVTEPIEFEINKTHVTIEITDENAKMPLTWAITRDGNMRSLAQNALNTFCEWMQMDFVQVEELAKQLEDVEDIKRFTINPKPITVTQKVKTNPKQSRSRSRTRSRRPQTKTVKKTVRSVIGHTTDFAKLLHGSLIDLQGLAEPLPDTGDRYESPLKYLGLWGSQRVNINTAPRHVLEAAFTFGGDAEDIAEEIIQRRREKPFKNIDELKSSLYRYSESIKKVEPYITTASRFFAIKVTAVRGRAGTSTVATVVKDRRSVKPIAIISHL